MNKHLTHLCLAWSWLCVLSLTSLLVSCVGTEVGNPIDHSPDTTSPSPDGVDLPEPAVIDFEFQGQEVNPSALTLSTGITLDEVWISFNKVRLVPLSECNGEAPEEIGSGEEGSQEEETKTSEDELLIVNLISGEELPSTPHQINPANNFCGFQFDLHTLDLDQIPSGAPEALAEHSMLIKGHLQGGSPFEIRADIEDRIDLEALNLQLMGQNRLFVSFALQDWLSGLDLEDQDEPLILSDKENSEAFALFQDRVLTSLSIYRDDNGDGLLNNNEQSQPLASSKE